MSKKFTEEQYQEIINIWNNGQDFDDTILSVSDYARKLNARLNYEYGDDVYDYSEAILLSLPNSREWAHKQFVEKEKQYVWTSKKPYYKDFYKRLYMVSNGLSKGVNGIGIAAYEKFNVSKDEYLTETEVRNNGYNPEMFDKEEAD